MGSWFILTRMNGKRISQLAQAVGVAVSTVRFYERKGLLSSPQRTPGGYRIYTSESEARLRFIVRGKRLGLSLDAISDLLSVWDGTNCSQTQAHLSELLDAKQLEIETHIAELKRFSAQLRDVQWQLIQAPESEICSPDLDCCAPEIGSFAVAVTHTRGRSIGVIERTSHE